ncbi:MAG: hypothetical protein QF911_02175 [Candidatus Thalassarchaeaceae archaeon]|jgi:hypothetical protein|nr:hypothetical protein [Candidatus Thalassarchaeaceae archaeon]
MDEARTLPDRTGAGESSFSPWIDRSSLLILAIGAIVAGPYLASFLEQWLGEAALAVTVCSLLVVVPILATSLGKIIVRSML